MYNFNKLFYNINFSFFEYNISLSDYHKALAYFGFATAISSQEKTGNFKNGYILTLLSDDFAVVIYLIFYQIGLIIKSIMRTSINPEILNEEILSDMKLYRKEGKKYILMKLIDISGKEQIYFQFQSESEDTVFKIPETLLYQYIKKGKYILKKDTDKLTISSRSINDNQVFFITRLIDLIIRNNYEYNKQYTNPFLFNPEKCYFITGQHNDILNIYNNLFINGLKVKDILPYNSWYWDLNDKTSKTCSIHKTISGHILLNIIKEPDLLNEVYEKYPGEVLVDLKNISEYMDKRERFLDILKAEKYKPVIINEYIDLYNMKSDTYEFSNYPYSFFSMNEINILNFFNRNLDISDSENLFFKKHIPLFSARKDAIPEIHNEFVKDDVFSKLNHFLETNISIFTRSEISEYIRNYKYLYYKSVFNNENAEFKFNDIILWLKQKSLNIESELLGINLNNVNNKKTAFMKILQQYQNIKNPVVVISTRTSFPTIKEIINDCINKTEDKPELMTIGNFLNQERIYHTVIVISWISDKVKEVILSNKCNKLVFIGYENENLRLNSFIKKMELIEKDETHLINNKLLLNFNNIDTAEPFVLSYLKNTINSASDKLTSNQIDQIIEKAYLEDFEERSHKNWINGNREKNIAVLFNNREEIFFYPNSLIKIADKKTEKKASELVKGDTVLIVRNEEDYSFENSLNKILLNDPDFKKLYNSTQYWRSVLYSKYKKKLVHSSHEKAINEIKIELEEEGVKRTIETISKWISIDQYYIGTKNEKKVIPIIFKLYKADELKIVSPEKNIKNISSYRSLRLSIGFEISRFILNNIRNVYLNFDYFKGHTDFLNLNHLFKFSNMEAIYKKLYSLLQRTDQLQVVRMVRLSGNKSGNGSK